MTNYHYQQIPTSNSTSKYNPLRSFGLAGITFVMSLFAITSCTNISQPSQDQSDSVDYTGYTSIAKEEWEQTSRVESICATGKVEIVNLYPDSDSIPSLGDNLYLVKYLRDYGFKNESPSSGNWEFGPRMVSISMKSTTCTCQVDKLYYSLENSNQYRITERLFCYANELP